MDDANNSGNSENSSKGSSSTSFERGQSEDTAKESLWMIRNLPEKMKTLGVLSLIRNLGVVAEEKRSEYQVLSINTYSKKNKLLTQAVLVMPDKMGQRLISHNGKKSR